jgi:agmatinase
MKIWKHLRAMTKDEKIKHFDPSAAGLKDANVYGLPFTTEEADIVLVAAPWEVTTSYGEGTSNGPTHILEASFQVDLYHPEFPELWKRGIAMDEIDEQMWMRSTDLKIQAGSLIEKIEDGVDLTKDTESQATLDAINVACEAMNQAVESKVSKWLDGGKKVGLIGGDHSTPLGYFRAQSKRHSDFGILHIDAHYDLRIAYEGFTYSHASIMYNALQLPQVSKIVSVGIRDYCLQEVEVAAQSKGRVSTFFNASIQRERFAGKTWKQQCDDIIAALPNKVHISFDIDGLDPTLCPNTGTPVPGGLWFDEATYLLSQLKASGKEIIGFDLVEVAPGHDDWNGNVGARLLFHLCGVLAM